MDTLGMVAHRRALRSLPLLVVAGVLACSDSAAPDAVVNVLVSPGSVTLASLGDTARLAASATNSAGAVLSGIAVAWNSSDTAVVRVDNAGLVVAVADGHASVTASAGGVAGQVPVTVAQRVVSATVLPACDTLYAIGATGLLSAVAYDARGHEVRSATFGWGTSNDSVVAVTDSGLVIAVRNGEATVVATAEGVQGQSRVSVIQKTASVAVSPAHDTLAALGDTVRLTAATYDALGHEVRPATVAWSVSGAGVVTVSDAGLVTAVSNGSASVVATAAGVSGAVSVVVTQRVTSIVASPTDVLLTAVGATQQLGAVAYDARGHAIESAAVAWSSSDSTVAAVTDAGLVRAVANGTARVLATAGTMTDTAVVAVEQRAQRLAFVVQPSATLETVVMAPAVRVAIQDSLGSTVTGDAAVVTLAIGANPASGTLSGALAVPAQAGVATFADLAVDNGSAGYTLTASSPGVPSATSQFFDVMLNFVQLSGGHVSTCGLTLAGRPYCWGYGGAGSLGTGDTTSQNYPTLVAGGLRFVQLAGALCGLTAAGSTYCWGNGQLVPTQLAGAPAFAAISVGGISACGVTPAGQAYCWGDGLAGELGDGLNTSSSTPVAVAGGHAFAEVSVGGAFACGVTPAGAGYCWGNNPDGQIGDSTTQLRSVPTLVWGGLAFAHIDAGGDHACGLTTMGALYCWGAGGGGELGDGNATSSPVPVAVAGNLIARSVDAGGYQNAASARSCAITTAGAAYCWGEALTGAAGVASSATPVAVDGGLAFNQISVGSYHVCAAAVSGAGYCWGYQLYGSLGTGSPSSADVPTPVAAPRPQ